MATKRLKLTKKANEAKAPAKPRAKAGTSKRGKEDRRSMFVDQYFLNNQNATQAAIAAGYSPKTAGQIGHALLKDLDIQARIRQRLDEAKAKRAFCVEELFEGMARANRFDPALMFDSNNRLLPINKMPPEVRLELESIDIEEKDINVRGRTIGTKTVSKVGLPKKLAAREQAFKYFAGLYGKLDQGSGMNIDPAKLSLLSAEELAALTSIAAKLGKAPEAQKDEEA